MDLRRHAAFYRIAAIASLLSVLSTLVLIFGRGFYPGIGSLADEMALWSTIEAAQQCLTLFAYDRWWVGWLAGDAAIVATMALRKVSGLTFAFG